MRKEAVRNSLDSLLLHSEHCPIPFRTCSFQREEKSPSNSLFSVYRNDRAALPALDASPSDSSEIPAPHAATATNPRGTRAQPAPYHHPCLPKSRQNPRRALNFRPSRSSRGIRHSAPVQPRHFGCGIRNPLSLRMSATRLHGPNPRRSSGSADNLPKNGYAESSENLPPPATGRAIIAKTKSSLRKNQMRKNLA